VVLITNALYNCSNYLGGSSCDYYIKIQKGGATMESDFLRADDISQMLGISKSSAYRLMRRLRKELDEQGLLTLPGIIPRHYLLQRLGANADVI
jgi:predicted DNA-binding transcriptional regulator AlpA